MIIHNFRTPCSVVHYLHSPYKPESRTFGLHGSLLSKKAFVLLKKGGSLFCKHGAMQARMCLHRFWLIWRMQIMNNGARSAEVVNYQGSGAAELRRDLAYKFARVAMRIGVKIHNHACMDWGFFADIRGAPRQRQNEVLEYALRARVAMRIQSDVLASSNKKK